MRANASRNASVGSMVCLQRGAATAPSVRSESGITRMHRRDVSNHANANPRPSPASRPPERIHSTMTLAMHRGSAVTMLATLKLAKRVLFETDKRLLWKLAYNMGLRGALSVHKHKRRMQRGQFFPPFLYVSIINTCNLRCQGCWVDVAAKQSKIEVAAMHKLITEAKAM